MMLRVFPLLAAAALVLLAPAASRAQDTPPKSGESPRAPTVTASAIVTDQYNVIMTVDDPSFFRPSSGFSLGGGGKAQKLKELRVWNGAHEISVPLDRIARIEVMGSSDQDLVQVRLTLTGNKVLEGKTERDLELRGRVEFGQYQIKFERLKSVTMRS